MYQFARDEWTLESTKRARERFAKFSDEKLLDILRLATSSVRSPIGAMVRGSRLTQDGQTRFAQDSLRIVGREWFCATSPDIAVVHVYFQV
jgi:hypothetical protein